MKGNPGPAPVASGKPRLAVDACWYKGAAVMGAAVMGAAEQARQGTLVWKLSLRICKSPQNAAGLVDEDEIQREMLGSPFERSTY